jgi:VWFA-related protein
MIAGANAHDRSVRHVRPSIAIVAAMAVVIAMTSGPAALAQEPQPPRFTSSVEVTSIDASVVDDRGQPIRDLKPSDFVVRVDGKERPVVSADWVPLAADANASTVFVPEGYSTNENAAGGRLIIIAVDQPNIRFGGGRAIVAAANAFIDRLSPNDRIAVTGFGVGAPATAFTADRERVKAALSRMAGQKQSTAQMTRQVSVAEAQAIDRGDRSTLQMVEDRECGSAGAGGRASAGGAELCRTEVEAEAQELARTASREGDQTLRGLRELLTGLKAIEAPKTLILISEGFLLDDVSLTTEVGALASAARTSVYALQLDQQMFDMASRAAASSTFADREARAEGLQTLVSTARGIVVTVTGSGASFFDRLEAELSGYYLVAVESDPRDRDGKPHPIRIDVSRHGATVRARRQFVSAPADTHVRSPREAVAAGLSTPLLLSALPLRVIVFALRGPERGKIQLLIHADIGSDYIAAKPVSIGYMLFDAAGRLADSQSVDARIGPIMNGVPSPLQYTAGASVAPGEYTLKLAVAEGDKAGSVEHPIHAALREAGGVSVSELMVGGPIGDADPLRPTIGYTVSFGAVHAYLEAYASKTDAVHVRYEIAANADGPALLGANAAAREAGEGRTLFSAIVPVPQLPAGRYVLRAIISNLEAPATKVTRAFEVTPPAVLMTSAEGTGAPASVDAELFLPVGDDLLARPFRRDHALSGETLKPFRERVPASVRTAFDAGVGMLAAGDYPRAEAALKRAIQPESDSTAPLVYLGVCFASAGHDAEATSVWQTALVNGGDLPQIYEWLGEALLRVHDLGAARTMYEEALGRWPADARFSRPLALVNATFGRGREAVRTLERYLAAQPGDRDALFLGVEWMYTVHAAGGVVHNRAEDVRLARGYAEAYEKAGGPQAALVKQWMDFLEK